MKCITKIALIIYFLCVCKCTICNVIEEVRDEAILFCMDLEDKCTDYSNAQRNVLLKKPNSRNEKIKAEKSAAEFIREESHRLKTNYDISSLDIPDVTRRQWEIYQNMGDIELIADSWNELVSFKNSNEDLLEKLQVPCYNKTKDCTLFKTDIYKALSSSRDENELKYLWSESQDIFSIYRKQYPNFLKLTKKAADVNGKENVREYWEMLVEFPNAYETAKELWSEIEPFYVKLHTFVRSRLEKYYSSLKNGENIIPVYLLGSEYGIDWSHIAPLVLPHRYLYDEIKSMLDFDKIGGKKAYEIAEKFTSSMGLGKAGDGFWMNSLFDKQCPSKFFDSCSEEYSFVITCNETNWVEYLNAHEDMMRTTINKINYPAVAYNSYRISALDEGLVSLANVLALKNLAMAGTVPEEVFFPADDDDESSAAKNNQMTALLLAALRIIPRLPYYLLADLWRLELMEKGNEITFNETVSTWWTHRETMQKVRGVTNMEVDFLGDPYIIANKPYIGKFFGNILQFQLLEYFQSEVTDGVNILTHMATDETFKTLLKQREFYNWKTTLYNNFYYEVATDSLLEYFKPLEEYIDNAPREQITQTVVVKTTTTTTTTTTTQKPTAVTVKTPVQPSINGGAITNDEPHTKGGTSDENQIKKSDENTNSGSVSTSDLTKLLNLLKPTKKPKIQAKDETVEANSSATAVWIGGAVGLAALAVIIVVVVRKRYRKRPVVTNRRHDV